MKNLYKMPYRGKLVTGKVIDRPNRFVLTAEVAGRVVSCYLANPGRLWELIYPDAEVLLAPSSGKTEYVALAARNFRGEVVPLHTHRANDLMAAVVDAGLLPRHVGARVLRREVTVGESRFDFLLREGGRELYAEVKCCTLFAGRGAYFPDAPSERAVRHLKHLCAMSRSGIRTALLMAVNSQTPQWFAPDWHTDPEFARALMEARGDVEIIPMGFRWNDDLSVPPQVKSLPVKLETVRRQMSGGGYCLAVLRREDVFRCVLQRSADLDEDLKRWKRKKLPLPSWAKEFVGEGKLVALIPFRSSDFHDSELRSEIDVLLDKKLIGEAGFWVGKFGRNPMRWPPFTAMILKERFIRYDENFISE
ncbi:MAG: DNA/RNA nuclease SfsA [Pyramidobacter sp.]